MSNSKNLNRRRFLSTSALAGLGLPLLFAGNKSIWCKETNKIKTVLNPLRMNAIDLRTFIRMGVGHIYTGGVDHRNNYLPFVTYNLTKMPTFAQHKTWGYPHMVGRFLDALAVSSEVISLEGDAEAEEGLRKLLHECLENIWIIDSWDIPFDKGKRSEERGFGNMHDCREILLALVGLMKWKSDDRSGELARIFVRAINRVTGKNDTFPGPTFQGNNWGDPDTSLINNTSGRLIRALVKYYKETKDVLAIDIAKRFAETSIKTFSPDGYWMETTGTHLHSLEGTMTSLIDLGIVTGEQRFLNFGRQLYEHGLRKFRTSYGWAAERSTKAKRGEANNTGDFIESAVLLGLHVDGKYFYDAERFVRNGLLASQIINTDWIPQSDTEDTDEFVYSDIRKRIKGAFAFTFPNSYSSYNTDLTGGAVQSLCEAHQAIISMNHSQYHINMLFSTDTPDITVYSKLPESGNVEITLHKKAELFVRMPEWVNREKIMVTVAGKKLPYRWIDQELFLGNNPAKTRIEIRFKQKQYHTKEEAYNNGTFEIDWIGDTIIGMNPAPVDGPGLY